MATTAGKKPVEIPPENQEPQQPVHQAEAPVSDWTSLTTFKATNNEIGIIKRSICKDLNNAEFAYFLNYCAEIKLHPLLKQVWVFRKKDWYNNKTKQTVRGELVMFTGRDGYRANAEKHPDFLGCVPVAVYENDDFSFENGVVNHKINSFKDRGALIGAYATCKRKNFDPYTSICRLEDFTKRKKARTEEQQQQQIEQAESTGRQSAWDTNEMDMIMTRAEAKALSKMFPISGMQFEGDWKKNTDGSVSPVQTNSNDALEETQEQLMISATEELFEIWKECKSKDKGFWKKQILDEQSKGELTLERIAEWKETLTTPEEKYKPEE